MIGGRASPGAVLMTTRDVQPGKPGDGPPGVVAVDLGRLDDVTSTLLKALGEHRARSR